MTHYKYTAFIILVLFTYCNNNSNKAYKPFEKTLKQKEYENINEAINSDKNNGDNYVLRSAIALQNNENQLAWLDATTAWKLNDNLNAANALINVIIETENKDAFLPYAIAVVNKFPTNIKLRRALQLVYYKRKQYNEALAQNDTIFMQLGNGVVPNIDFFLQDRGKLYLELGDTIKATKNFEQAFAISPKNEDAFFELANIYANVGNPKVLLLCDTFIKKSNVKELAEPFYYKAVYYNTINNNAAALKEIENAATINYSFIDTWLLKGDIFLKQGNLGEAETAFNTAINLSKTNADAWFGLAEIAEKKSDKQNAYLYYGRAYGFDSTYTEAAKGMERNK